MRPVALLALALLLPVTAFAEPSVGRVNTRGFDRTQMCSGTLISPSVVLTAAHCVADPETGVPKSPEDLVFVAGWTGAGHVGAAEAEAFRMHPRAFEDGRLDLRHDVALIRLSAPLDLPRLTVGPAAVSQSFDVLGYAFSRPNRLDIQQNCAARARSGLWYLDCGVEKGQSGGPVLHGAGDARRIVAVVAGRLDGEALAVPIDPWVLRQASEMARPRR